MTKENAKDYLPFVQALAEGKDLIVNCGSEMADSWEVYTDDLGSLDAFPIEFIRIKPDELWYVVQSQNGYEIKCSSEFETDPCREFESSDKSECEKWITDHKPQYVPFDTIDELIECWNKKLHIPIIAIGKLKYADLAMPLIWIKGKGTQAKLLITEYWSASVGLGTTLCNLKDLYACYTFLDGTPIGKIKE